MGNLVLNGATSGATTLQPTDATTQTITLPANSGTVITTASTFAGTGPAFYAKLSADQTGVSQGTWVKLQLATEVYDTNSCFNTSTYRFTPNVAGYYLITANVGVAPSVTGQFIASLWRNGTEYVVTYQASSITTNAAFTGSIIMYMNGSTDYVELYGFIDSGGTRTFQSEGGLKGWMSGALVRTA